MLWATMSGVRSDQVEESVNKGGGLGRVRGNCIRKDEEVDDSKQPAKLMMPTTQELAR